MTDKNASWEELDSYYEIHPLEPAKNRSILSNMRLPGRILVCYWMASIFSQWRFSDLTPDHYWFDMIGKLDSGVRAML